MLLNQYRNNIMIYITKYLQSHGVKKEPEHLQILNLLNKNIKATLKL